MFIDGESSMTGSSEGSGSMNTSTDDWSDDESDDGQDHHPNPLPVDPDMTGWSANQIGRFCY